MQHRRGFNVRGWGALGCTLAFWALTLPFSARAAAQDARHISDPAESKMRATHDSIAERKRSAATAQTPVAGVSGSDSYPVPDWVYDARWYYIDVPRFHNGDKSNDPPGTAAWTAVGPRKQRERQTFGGDLRGLVARIPYLLQLGVSAVILDGWDDAGSFTGATATHDVRSAATALHGAGIRVLLRATETVPRLDELLPFLTPEKGRGVDGFLVHAYSDPNELIRKLKERNPACVLIPASGALLGLPQPWRPPLLCDVREQRWLRDTGFITLVACDDKTLDGPDTERLRTFLTSVFPPEVTRPGRTRTLATFDTSKTPIVLRHLPVPNEKAYSLGRLATVLKHFLPGAPLTHYGDEVGMYSWSTPFYIESPMWWNDLPDPKTKSPDYRGDFFALVQWLHKMRENHKPLRRGGFRLVLNDEKNKIFAFARTLPGDEVILVMNYGDKKQMVMLPAGSPGQIVVAMTPMIDPARSRWARMIKGGYDHTKIHSLPVGGGRASVNKSGEVRVWVESMSIRVVLVNDVPPLRK